MEQEQTRVLKGRTGGDLLVLCNLSKSFRGLSGRRAAVHDVSLGLRRGEVRERVRGAVLVTRSDPLGVGSRGSRSLRIPAACAPPAAADPGQRVGSSPGTGTPG